jgi:monothiol bacilliredoxin
LSGIIKVDSEAALSEAVSSGHALIYKHSARCWVSHMARKEVSKFHKDHPDTPIYEIDVVGERGLSMRAAELLHIPHASPQAIFVCEGKPVWVATHGSVRAKSMEKSAAGCPDRS